MRILLALILGTASIAHSQIVLQNWNLTPTSVSFTLSGSATVGFTGKDNPQRLSIGVPGDGDWISVGSPNTGPIAGSLDGLSIIDGGAQNWGGTGYGDYIFLATPAPMDFTNGGTVSVNVSITAGSYIPANINPDDIIVTWGLDPSNYTDVFGGVQIGAIETSAVPEPSTYAAIAFGVLGFTLIIKRRVRKKSEDKFT